MNTRCCDASQLHTSGKYSVSRPLLPLIVYEISLINTAGKKSSNRWRGTSLARVKR